MNSYHALTIVWVKASNIRLTGSVLARNEEFSKIAVIIFFLQF